jgi:hypothetical protein
LRWWRQWQEWCSLQPLASAGRSHPASKKAAGLGGLKLEVLVICSTMACRLFNSFLTSVIQVFTFKIGTVLNGIQSYYDAHNVIV